MQAALAEGICFPRVKLTSARRRYMFLFL